MVAQQFAGRQPDSAGHPQRGEGIPRSAAETRRLSGRPGPHAADQRPKTADGAGPLQPGDLPSPAFRGGIGCTSLAINLACCLAANPQCSVALIDLDLALGDADVWLDIIPDYTIQDVAENITRLDYALLKRSLTKHDCGLFLLAAAGGNGRPPADDAGRTAPRDRAAESDVHASGHRLQQELHRPRIWRRWRSRTRCCWSRSSICRRCATPCG